MNPLGIALGFVILGFVGGVGSFLTIAGARNVYFGSQAHRVRTQNLLLPTVSKICLP
ncbi:MAG: hypothetical protein M0T85_16305 [Dehalococcoidales bacterium]|nr:hypothetical protein [Dehalococcoidales bacterium]